MDVHFLPRKNKQTNKQKTTKKPDLFSISWPCHTFSRLLRRCSLIYLSFPSLPSPLLKAFFCSSFQINAKYDKNVEMDVRRWIEDVVDEPVEWGAEDDAPGSAFADGLKNGEVLCKYGVSL